jgi:hypothetical protein
MRTGFWVAAGLVGLTAACGGSGTPSGGPDGGGPSGFYVDVVGYPGAEPVKVTDWPSYLHPKTLMAPCSAGEVSYADDCWQTMVVDADVQKVTFAKSSGASSTISLGQPVPAALGSLTVVPDPILYSNGTIDNAYPGVPGPSGYVLLVGPVQQGLGWSGFNLWERDIAPIAFATPSVRTPWALAQELKLQHGAVLAFLVKTTMFYGFQVTDPSDPFTGFGVVYNWSYSGHVRVNGHDLAFPLHLADLTAVVGLAARSAQTESLTKYVDLPGTPVVRFVSNGNVMGARSQYHSGGLGLSDADLVTSIEFHSVALSPL